MGARITTQPRMVAGILPPWRSAGAMRLRSSGNYTHSVAGLADSWSLPTNSISLQKD